MRRTTMLTAGLIAMMLAVLIAACGDDDDSPSEARSSNASTQDDGTAAFGGFGDSDDAVDTFAADVAEEAAPPRDSGANFAFGADGEAGVTTAQELGRTIIRNGSVALEVESVDEAFESVRSVAVANGGFVADSSFYGGDPIYDEDGNVLERPRFASLTMRVPAERFEQVVSELRALAIEVTSISTSSQDVTGEVTDLESELRNLRAVEAQYLELLGRANAIGDVLQVQDRLNSTRSQIERVEGRIALLDNLADLATLRVELRTPITPVVAEGGSSGPLDAARAGWEASLETLATIAAVGLAVAAFSWWLVPLIVIAALLVRRTGAIKRLPRATMDA